MFTLFRQFFFGPPRPQTRMTEEEVRMVADQAAQKARILGTLARVTVRRVEGRIVWTASTPTKGGGWSVTIDDATDRGRTGKTLGHPLNELRFPPRSRIFNSSGPHSRRSPHPPSATAIRAPLFILPV